MCVGFSKEQGEWSEMFTCGKQISNMKDYICSHIPVEAIGIQFNILCVVCRA